MLTAASTQLNVGKDRITDLQTQRIFCIDTKPFDLLGNSPQAIRSLDGKMLPMSPDDLKLLLTREMPFGKHKGIVIADLPGNYLKWFAREGFPHGEIGRLLQLMHEIDHNGLSYLLEPLRTPR